VHYVIIASLITRMRKQCAPGLLFPSPRRPGYEANSCRDGTAWWRYVYATSMTSTSVFAHACGGGPCFIFTKLMMTYVRLSQAT